MHKNSLDIMARLLAEYSPASEGLLAYDVGSQDINGTYRELVTSFGWIYVGLDICEGENVDLVVREDTSWDYMPASKLVVSGQCVEHTKRPWEWIHQVKSLMAVDGVLILIAPAMWPEHKFPIDCWRLLPDGMRALADWAGLVCLCAELSPTEDMEVGQQDCFAVMKRLRDE